MRALDNFKFGPDQDCVSVPAQAVAIVIEFHRHQPCPAANFGTLQRGTAR